MPLVHLLTTQTSAYRSPDERVIRDATTWTSVWAELHEGAPEAPAPAVDFTQRVVVLVATGERSTGGVTVHVDAVEPDARGAVVRYTVSVPGRDCMTTQALTAPVDVVSAPRPRGGEIRFDRRTRTTPC